ncbi:MAG TPA: PASTA domain-containing protein [Gaiellaceae bacterium]
MHRRFIAASAIAVVVAAALLTGSGARSSAAVVGGQRALPAGLAAAIRARLGAAARAHAYPPELGWSVAVSADGTTALVGASGVEAAYIFHSSDAGSWSSRKAPTATLTDKNAGDFGVAVALSADGTTAFVGADETGGGDAPAGAIYVFHVAAEDAWVSSSAPAATLTVSGAYNLGAALALSPDGTTLVAGTPFSNSGVGGADVFHVSSEDAWVSTSTPTASLSNAAQSADDYFVGFSVAVAGDGTTVLVGDSFNTDDGGDAYLYHVSSEDGWATSSTPTAILSNAGSSSHFLGYSVALSGDGTVALIGDPLAGSRVGAADVFRASAADAWASTSTPTAVLTRAGGRKNDFGGYAVALSTDGMTAVVSAPGRSVQRGAAYVFRAPLEAAWASSSAPAATLANAGGRKQDFFGGGLAVSSDGRAAFLGAPFARAQTGAVDIFHVSDASSWASDSKPKAILTNTALDACWVPKLVGLKLRAAKSALKAARCRLGHVHRERVKHKKGRVVSQHPRPNSRLQVGGRVSVIVGR